MCRPSGFAFLREHSWRLPRCPRTRGGEPRTPAKQEAAQVGRAARAGVAGAGREPEAARPRSEERGGRRPPCAARAPREACAQPWLDVSTGHGGPGPRTGCRVHAGQSSARRPPRDPKQRGGLRRAGTCARACGRESRNVFQGLERLATGPP